MGKFINILMIMLVVQVLLLWSNFAPGSTLLSQFFGTPDNMGDIQNNSLYETFRLILIGLTAAAIIASFFGSQQNENFLIGAIVSSTMIFIVDIVSIISYIKGKATLEGTIPDPFAYVIILIYGLLTVSYLYAAIDWWRGRD